jgi:hypothetical protein
MKTITKALAVGGMLAALGTAGWQAMAAPPANPGPAPEMMGRAGAMFGNPAARLDTWKTDLGIRPGQQTAWDGYVKMVTDLAGSMQAAHRTMTSATTPDMATMQAFGREQMQSFASLRTAATTLLGRLDATQAARARALLPGLAGPGGGMMQVAMMGGGMMGGAGATAQGGAGAEPGGMAAHHR